MTPEDDTTGPRTRTSPKGGSLSAADQKKAAAQKAKKPNPAKLKAAQRAIAAGQRLARHAKGHAGSKLAALGRAATQKATQLQGAYILGLTQGALAAQSELDWSASMDALAQVGEIAANVLPLADQVKAAGQLDLANQGYGIAQQAQSIIDNNSGDAFTGDASFVGQVQSVAGAASTWTSQANAALASGTAAATPPAATTPDAGATAADGGGGFSGGGGDAGGDFGGGDGGGGPQDDYQAAAEMEADAGQAQGPVDWGDGSVEAFDQGPAPLDDMFDIDAASAAADASAQADSGTGDTTTEDNVIGNPYILGADILAGDFGTGAAPSAPMDYGPSIGPGTVYTDAKTITAVQKALNAKGQPLKVDGIFGPQTEAALFAVTGKHGPPDDASLAQLGVKPGGSSGTAAESLAALKKIFTGTPAPTSTALVKVVPWWSQPAWTGAPIDRKQAALLGGGAVLLGTGIILAVRG